jgi:hypothetical protein
MLAVWWLKMNPEVSLRVTGSMIKHLERKPR